MIMSKFTINIFNINEGFPAGEIHTFDETH